MPISPEKLFEKLSPRSMSLVLDVARVPFRVGNRSAFERLSLYSSLFIFRAVFM